MTTTDVWAAYATLDAATQERLAGVLETRGADPQQQALRRAFLADITFPTDAHVLDVGCGTGVLTRMLARLPGIAAVVGVDLAHVLIEKARELAAGYPNLTFEQADARCLPFGDGTVDVVVFDSVLSHIADTEAALAEAFRVLRPHGHLAVFDGDYATATVALGDHDPLQACVDTMMEHSVTHRRVMRRVRRLADDSGFDVHRLRSHGFVETTEGQYMLTVIDRGADLLRALGQLTTSTADALKAEARARSDAGTFFGHIAYAGLIARKRAPTYATASG